MKSAANQGLISVNQEIAKLPHIIFIKVLEGEQILTDLSPSYRTLTKK